MSELFQEPTDSEFCELYYKAISVLLGIAEDDNSMFHPLCRYMDIIRPLTNAYCQFFHGETISKDDTILMKECLFYRINYVYRNSTLISSATAFHFGNLLKENPKNLENLLRQPQIRICSIGGGPASDLVGIVHVLEKIAAARGQIDLDIWVTVLDVDPSWESTCLSVLSCLKRFRDFRKVKFMHADLSSPFYSEETMSAIQNAHVVTAVNFVSAFTSIGQSAQWAMKAINEIIRPGSLFFILDYFSSKVLLSCGEQIGTLIGSDLVYEEPYVLHVLDRPSIKRNFQLFSKILKGHVFNTTLKLFARGFLKADIFTPPIEPKRFVHRLKTKWEAVLVGRSSFRDLERFTAKKMHQMGWIPDRVYMCNTDLVEKMDELFSLLAVCVTKVEAECEALYKEFITTGIVEDSSWESYLSKKKDMADIQKTIFCELVVRSRNNWKLKLVNVL